MVLLLSLLLTVAVACFVATISAGIIAVVAVGFALQQQQQP